MPENMMNKAHKGSNQASRAGYDQTKWDGGKVEPRPAEPRKEVQFIRCPKCTYRRMALIERCPVCGCEEKQEEKAAAWESPFAGTVPTL